MKTSATLTLTLALLLGAPVVAHAEMNMSSMDSTQASEKAADATGVVEAVDTGKGTVTISHEAIKSLDWPPMTMDFSARDKKLFGKLAKGKKIHFSFVQQHGDYVITKVSDAGH